MATLGNENISQLSESVMNFEFLLRKEKARRWVSSVIAPLEKAWKSSTR